MRLSIIKNKILAMYNGNETTQKNIKSNWRRNPAEGHDNKIAFC